MAGLEPALLRLSVENFNQLNYIPIIIKNRLLVENPSNRRSWFIKYEIFEKYLESALFLILL